MEQQFARTEMLLGKEGLERLRKCRVAVFGLGGVGGYAAEALARSGIGAVDLIDHDSIAPSNLNRQILALHSTVGEDKADAAEKRILDIFPECRVRVFKTFFLPETAGEIDFSVYDYVVDAIDTVTGKLAIAAAAEKAGVPLISVMGTGNKLDPTKLCVSWLHETKVCPLAKVMRRECKKRGIGDFKVVWSREEPYRPIREEAVAGENEAAPVRRKDVPGSMVFVPGAAGLAAASEVVRDLLGRA